MTGSAKSRLAPLPEDCRHWVAAFSSDSLAQRKLNGDDRLMGFILRFAEFGVVLSMATSACHGEVLGTFEGRVNVISYEKVGVATSAPPAAFSKPISRARLVGGFIVLAVARAFAAVVDGLVDVLRFDLAFIFASSTWARADPAPPTGASPDGAGRAREAGLGASPASRAMTLTLRSGAKSSRLSRGPEITFRPGSEGITRKEISHDKRTSDDRPAADAQLEHRQGRL